MNEFYCFCCLNFLIGNKQSETIILVLKFSRKVSAAEINTAKLLPTVQKWIDTHIGDVAKQAKRLNVRTLVPSEETQPSIWLMIKYYSSLNSKAVEMFLIDLADFT